MERRVSGSSVDGSRSTKEEGDANSLLILENMIQSDLLTTRVFHGCSEHQRRLEVFGNLLVDGVTLRRRGREQGRRGLEEDDASNEEGRTLCKERRRRRGGDAGR